MAMLSLALEVSLWFESAQQYLTMPHSSIGFKLSSFFLHPTLSKLCLIQLFLQYVLTSMMSATSAWPGFSKTKPGK